jgi:transposase
VNAASLAETKIVGRKQHLLVDTLGLLLAVKVHSAGIVDRRGAPVLLEDLAGRFPRLSHLFADRASTGPLIQWIKRHLDWEVEIVPKPDRWAIKDGELVRLPGPKGGFQVQHHRWKIERPPGWLIRSRRLVRDDEGLLSSSEALIQVAPIRLFLTRLTPFCSNVTWFRHTLSR